MLLTMATDSTGHLRVCTFAGASSLPLFIALERDFFATQGLVVDLVGTRSSKELMEGLLDKSFTVVHAAPDNFIAWRDRTAAPIVAWIGGTSGPVRLVAAPDVTDIKDLRGREIAVDAPESGFVSVLRKILRQAGVSDQEISLQAIGATNLRFDALREGRTAATMLTLPWSAIAEEEGFKPLADQRDVLPRLQGSCAASLEPWLTDHSDSADAYLRALVTALTWAYMPANGDAVRKLLASRYEVDPSRAEAVRRAILDPNDGWPPSAFIDPEGMESVCQLRTENGMAPQEPASAYYTLEPYRRVFGFGRVQG